MPNSILLSALAIASTLVASAPGQQLRRAVASADLVVVGKAEVTMSPDEDVILYQLRIARTLKGDAPAQVTVVHSTGLSLHNRPVEDTQRLFCLHDYSAAARKAGLPPAQAPYFKMSGYAGSNPMVAANDPADDPAVQFAQIVLDSENGTSAHKVLPRLLTLVFNGTSPINTESVNYIREREVLRDAIDPLGQSQLLSRAVGESDDVQLKIALAQLCGECRMDGLVEALCQSMDAMHDREFAATVGRIASYLHGERAAKVLAPFIDRARGTELRGNLLVALGATSTEAALDALLRLRSKDPGNEYIEAALRLHGSKRAIEAIK